MKRDRPITCPICGCSWLAEFGERRLECLGCGGRVWLDYRLNQWLPIHSAKTNTPQVAFPRDRRSWGNVGGWKGQIMLKLKCLLIGHDWSAW